MIGIQGCSFPHIFWRRYHININNTLPCSFHINEFSIAFFFWVEIGSERLSIRLVKHDSIDSPICAVHRGSWTRPKLMPALDHLSRSNSGARITANKFDRKHLFDHGSLETVRRTQSFLWVWPTSGALLIILTRYISAHIGDIRMGLWSSGMTSS